MTRENIRVSDPNFTTDGNNFYCLLNTAQTLQAKSADGTVAFSYPLDTTIDNTVISLSWDGVYFWSLESKTGGMIIRKWAIDAYLLKLITKFEFTNDSTHTYSPNDMAVERYEFTVGDNNNGSGGYTYGMTDINISDTSVISPGDVLTFVRRRTPTHSRYSSSYVETATVQTVVDSDTVRLTAAMSGDPYGDGKGFRGPSASYNSSTEPVPPDLVYVTKHLWVINQYAPADTSTSAVYKINSTSGGHITQYTGTQYSNVKGACFYTNYNTSGVFPWVYNTTINSDDRFLLFVNSSALLFYNVSSLSVEKSLNLDVTKANGVDVWDVYDLTVLGHGSSTTLLRLQSGTTYGDPEADESWSAYNYEKTLLARVVDAISVTVEPSVLPSDGVSTASVTAYVTDQYGQPVQGKTVSWADDGGGSLSPTTSTTDAFGRATTTYTAGTTEEDVKITATVQNGLI